MDGDDTMLQSKMMIVHNTLQVEDYENPIDSSPQAASSEYYNDEQVGIA